MAMSRPPSGDPGDDRYAPLAEINVTPMVDVMLVLLVIFMITAPLLQVGVPVDLPKTSAQQVGGNDGDRRVRLVGRTRQLQVECVARAIRADEFARLHRPTDFGPPEAARAAPVSGAVTLQDRPARGTHRGVRRPALAHRYPSDIRDHARRPHDMRIVSVGDRRKSFGGSENSAPPPRDHRHLTDPVELVASQVAQDEQRLFGVRQ